MLEIIPIILTSITALASITIPFFITLINNRKELKKLKIQIHYSEKFEITKDMMTNYAKYSISYHPTHKSLFISSLSKYLMVCDPKLKNDIIKILNSTKISTDRLIIDEFITLLPGIYEDFNSSKF